jgi:D-3-phosphoglycerate dehydrogenase
MNRILIADPIHAEGLRMLRDSGADVHELSADERPRLKELIADFDALVVRSSTQVDAGLLRAGRRLKVVGRAGIGVDNVDVATATELGVLVVNAPTANLVSATEHTFALMLALARNVPAADRSLKSEEWDRKRFLGCELQGKTLGVVGLGRIGQAVAARARAFEMRVLAFDPYLDPAVAKRLDIELGSLDEILPEADFVTLHVPLTEHTRNVLSAERIASLKEGAMVVNCARGGTVDDSALLAALESGQLAGAALDVFEQEPPQSFELIQHPKVVCTPHIGAQTREAQARVGTQTARMLLAALEGSLAISAVNLPFSSAGTRGEPYLALAERLGLLASALQGGSIQSLQVDLWGVDEALQPSVAIAAVKGALTPFLGEGVNYVNAERVAEGRGIQVTRASHQHAGEYPQLIGVRVKGESGESELAGTIFGDADPRVVRFETYRLEFRPEGKLLVLQNRDVPGVVGKIGTLLGEAGANIAEIHLAREAKRDLAMAVIRLDQEPAGAVLESLGALPEVARVRLVELD